MNKKNIVGQKDELELYFIFYTYSHGQELFYKFVSNFTNKLVKQLLSMTVQRLKSICTKKIQVVTSMFDHV